MLSMKSTTFEVLVLSAGIAKAGLLSVPWVVAYDVLVAGDR